MQPPTTRGQPGAQEELGRINEAIERFDLSDAAERLEREPGAEEERNALEVFWREMEASGLKSSSQQGGSREPVMVKHPDSDPRAVAGRQRTYLSFLNVHIKQELDQ